HHMSLRMEAARILIDLRKYAEADRLLTDMVPLMEDSADVMWLAGLCKLKTGRLPEGEAMILKALDINPKVQYGEPYLRLGEAYAAVNLEKSLDYLRQFGAVQSSSCEAYYRLGVILNGMGRTAEAGDAFAE